MPHVSPFLIDGRGLLIQRHRRQLGIWFHGLPGQRSQMTLGDPPCPGLSLVLPFFYSLSPTLLVHECVSMCVCVSVCEWVYVGVCGVSVSVWVCVCMRVHARTCVCIIKLRATYYNGYCINAWYYHYKIHNYFEYLRLTKIAQIIPLSAVHFHSLRVTSTSNQCGTCLYIYFNMKHKH